MKPTLFVILTLVALPAFAQGPAPDSSPAPAAPSLPEAKAGPAQAAAPAQLQATPASGARILSLEEALRIGFARQPQLLQAKAQTEAGRGRVDQALAPLLPQVTGTATYLRTSNSIARLGKGVGSTSPGTQELYSAGLTGSQLIWDFNQTIDRWRASRASESSLEATEHATSESIALTIRTAYFNAVAGKALVDVARDTLANEMKHFGEVRAQVEIGTRPPVDLVQERVNVANDQVRLIQAENTYATARVQVEQAIGATDLGTWDTTDETLPPLRGEDAAPDVLLEEALKSRPDLASDMEAIRSQELTVQSLLGGYGPSLGLQIGVSDAGPQPNDLTSGWSTQLTLTWPLFQGGLTRGQVREARANVSFLQAQLEALKQQVRLDVEQARLSVRAAVATLSAAQDASQAAREQLTLQEGRYQAGVGTIIELSDAQTSLTTALGQEVQSRFQLAIARSQLLHALGRTD